MPSPGHTPGHASVEISSKGRRALITGDFAHHPCQMAHPEWSSTADYDPAAAEATRHRLFSALAGEPVLVLGTHFAGPTAGHVVRDGNAYKLLI
jgi:glyoxylase-like metal-dependent hydrolase (beta-lactamase superfamily II)